MFELNEVLVAGGFTPWMIAVFVIIMIWSSIWKFIALWKAARKNALPWFIVFAVVNTIGILEILYIFIFSDKKKSQKKRK